MKKKIASFQENIRNTFIAYALVPVFVATCLCFLIFSIIWRCTIIHDNRKDNQKVYDQFITILDSYEETLDKIEAILREKSMLITDSTKADLYEKIYEVGSKCNCQSNFYLLDADQEVLFSFGDDAPAFLRKPEYFDWGILRSVQQQKNEISFQITNGKLCMGKAIYDESDVLQGIMVFTFSSAAVKEEVKVRNRQVIITDAMGWIFFNTLSGMSDNLGRIHPLLAQKDGFIRYDAHHYYVTASNVENKNLWIYTIYDSEMRTNVIWLLIGSTAVIFLGIGIFTYYSTKKMAMKYTYDIDEIANAFEKVKQGDLSVKLNINSTTEFLSIGEDFNVMVKGLQQQINQNQELVEHVAFAQVKQLESQFNPHFLFNTLDNIRFMTKLDINAADKMIVSLSRLLRYSIRDVREELTVREDLDNLQSYLNILQIRFNKRFSYEIDIEDRVMDDLIPKLLIQPLLENAVKYGFLGKEKLHVKIKGYEKNEELVFICQDDGVGMDKALLQEIRNQLLQDRNTSTHMGLYNIHRRIQLLYKGNYGMKIESESDKGTTIVLILPVRK